MRILILCFLGISLVGRAEDWTTCDGKVYRDVKILSKDDAYVTILDRDGGGKIAICNLSPEIRKELKYDESAANRQVEADKDEQNREEQARAAAKLLYDNQWIAHGKIIQVVPGGIMVRLFGHGTKIHTVTDSSETKTAISSGTMSLGQHSDVFSTEVTYSSRNYQDNLSLERAFIECDNTGLSDDDHWEGTIWKIGTYSYPMVSGSMATIPKFTTNSKEAYLTLTSPQNSSVSVSGN